MEEEHLSPLKATKKAMHEIAGAIIAITFLMVFFQLPVWSSRSFL
jgi:HAE1 family hydrophobic/amphiphilic exporter-1